MASITLDINGEVRTVEADPDTPLVFVLRNALGLTGAKLGCGLEQCGACAVLADGEHALSCVRSVESFVGTKIVTPEALGGDGLNAVQKMLAEEGAAQCGYCTPGIAVALTALLAMSPKPSRSEVQEALRGHLCRCGSHARVLAAIERLTGEGAASAD
jgi:aerobic-type carbon monoxide dehydrogenase small subunit (CoxS/CutS family)